jgi:biotin synthase
MEPLFIRDLTEKILQTPAAGISPAEALDLAATPPAFLMDLIAGAHRITTRFFPEKIFTCAILNAKSGRCSQDCAFCAQSAHHQTGVSTYPLMSREKMTEAALKMAAAGATCFSMVTSGERLSDAEIQTICAAAKDITSQTGLSVCGSLGLLTDDQARALKESGLVRYHHNLETAESFFDRICTTHTYGEDLRTLKAAAASGLMTCAGGIIGLGESWAQRVELAFTLKNLRVDRIPLNFLNPIPGTRLSGRPLLPALDAIKTIALFRFILPRTDITICGGREITLKDFQSWIFPAGATGVMIGNYLTTRGRDLEADREMIAAWENFRKSGA